jgi:hypothetical protein
MVIAAYGMALACWRLSSHGMLSHGEISSRRLLACGNAC